jgi:hypothetical protein
MEEDITNIIISTDQVLSAEDYPYTLSLRRKDLDDEKSLNKFIMSCEKLVRISPEYRMWTYYIRDVLGNTTCCVTGEKHSETTIEIHHHPYSLYTYTKGVVLKKIHDNEEFCSFDIATKIVELHYEMKVPFCLLVLSLHKKYHNGAFLIPMSLVMGDRDYFLKNYSFYLPDDEQETILRRFEITEENCGWNFHDGYRWVKYDKK